jgi:hypothetical protein
MQLLGFISVGFDVAGQLLFIFSAFARKKTNSVAFSPQANGTN